MVTSNRLPDAGTVLKTGNGDLARPDELRGNFQIAVDSLPASISIIETDSKFYVKLPFQSNYQLSDPSKYGFGDPASIIDPNTGISRLLVQISNPKVTGQTRVSGELLENISGTVPGTDVTAFLPDVAPSQPVQLVLGIDPTSDQVRQVQATGPFAVATTQSTYLVTLTDYNEAVTITAPAT
jgi:lipoprotein LprG